MLSPAAPAQHWDVIEGQGSLFHPAYAAVALGLLHGSQPDVIVVCHEVGRKEVLGHPGYALPEVAETIDLNLRLGRRTNPAIRCAGVSINTHGMSDSDAARLLASESARIGLPVADLDVFEDRHFGLRLLLLVMRGDEGVQLRLVDQDSSPPAVSTETVVRESALGAPLVNQRIADAEAFSGLLRREHGISAPSPFPGRSPLLRAPQAAARVAGDAKACRS